MSTNDDIPPISDQGYITSREEMLFKILMAEIEMEETKKELGYEE